MTSFLLKCIALFSMVIDHVSLAYFKYTTIFNVLGRIAFPIFAYQISEGYSYTKNIKKYLLRLLLFAFISQIPFNLFQSLFTDTYNLNIFFTLFLGLLAICIYEKLDSYKNKNTNKYLYIINICSFILISVFCILAEICKLDYGFFGIAVIFLFHLFKKNKLRMNISFIFLITIKYILDIITYGYHYLYILLFLGTISSLIFINLYTGKQGKKTKYLLYLFYPIHLFLLYILFR